LTIVFEPKISKIKGSNNYSSISLIEEKTDIKIENKSIEKENEQDQDQEVEENIEEEDYDEQV